MKLYDEYGDIIAKARGGQGLHLEAVANAGGLTPSQLQRIENYEVLPGRSVSDSLANVLNLDEEALWELGQENYEPRPPQNLRIQLRTVEVSSMESNAYIVYVPSVGQAVIVDAGGNADKIVQAAAKAEWAVVGILITHGHSDHLAALPEVAARLQVPVLMHPAITTKVSKRQVLPWQGAGDYAIGGIAVSVMETPGHSVDSISFLVAGALFSGDTLFAGSLGRARTKEAYAALLASGRRLLSLPIETGVFPGHGKATTVEQERRYNPFVGGNRCSIALA